nr:hypothetical protein [uncultured Thiodictyon sp.]
MKRLSRQYAGRLTDSVSRQAQTSADHQRGSRQVEPLAREHLDPVGTDHRGCGVSADRGAVLGREQVAGGVQRPLLAVALQHATEQEAQGEPPLGDRGTRGDDGREPVGLTAGAGQVLGSQELLDAQVVEAGLAAPAAEQQAGARKQLVAAPGGGGGPRLGGRG